jgi:hypothetical protein
MDQPVELFKQRVLLLLKVLELLKPNFILPFDLLASSIKIKDLLLSQIKLCLNFLVLLLLFLKPFDISIGLV